MEEVMKLFLKRSIPFSALAAIAACQADDSGLEGPAGPDRTAAAAPAPVVTGTYTGTASGVGRSDGGPPYAASCPVVLTISSQNEGGFDGSFTVQAAGECQSYGSVSGTLKGTVQLDGTFSAIFDTPRPGANIFEDGASASGCTLVSSTGSLSGSFSSGQWSGNGSGTYDCPKFGNLRIVVEVSFSATRQ
jgi:hypothetical protein